MNDNDLQTAFFHIGGGRYGGYVVNARRLSVRYAVDILVDGLPICIARANERVAALVCSAVGDGCYGFAVNLARELLRYAHVIEARISNLDYPVGSPIVIDGDLGIAPILDEYVEWHGGLRFSGWTASLADPESTVTACIDNEEVVDVRPSGWKAFGSSFEDATAVPSFSFHLPEQFADGRVRTLRIMDQTGRELAGSPIKFVAYGDQLERSLRRCAGADGEQLRVEMFRTLFPQSFPLSRYDDWVRRFPAQSESVMADSRPIAVVLFGEEEETRLSIASLNKQRGSWIAAGFPRETSHGSLGASLLKDFLTDEAAHCGNVVFCWAGAEFSAGGLIRMDRALEESPETLLVYGDFSVRLNEQRRWPVAFPAFDYERFLEQGYCCNLFAVSRQSLITRLSSGNINLFKIAFQLVAGPASGAKVVHLPGECAVLPYSSLRASSQLLADAVHEHLLARGSAARARPLEEGMFPAVRVLRSVNDPTTEIIISTRNRMDMLKRCIESIRPAAGRTKSSITIIDNDSTGPDIIKYFQSLEQQNIRVLRLPGIFNRSRLNNFAAMQSTAHVLCFVGDRVEALDDHWLEELVGRLSEPDVGAAGPLLLSHSGVVQDGGLILGPGLAAVPAFHDRMDTDAGYSDLLRVAHQCSAVAATCLVTKREEYLRVGGFDEVRFPIHFNDVDYCLKLYCSGRRVVFSPHARLIHSDSTEDPESGGAGLLQRELGNLRSKWLDVLADDPFYSPMLALDGLPYSGLAWPPRNLLAARRAVHRAAVPMPENL